METRKITVLSTRTQTKHVIMSAATTLSQLKSDLDKEGISYSDMTFYEGLSKTELKDDSSILPHDVPYKGQTTNELVFMLTTPNKKIKSGMMSRAEVYAIIKAKNLQAKCVEIYGKNFTMCKTSDLIELINKRGNSSTPKEVSVNKKENTEIENKSTNKENSITECKDAKLRGAFLTMIDILKNVDILDEEDKMDILNELGISRTSTFKSDDTTSKSTYSENEIDDMFDFVK